VHGISGTGEKADCWYLGRKKKKAQEKGFFFVFGEGAPFR